MKHKEEKPLICSLLSNMLLKHGSKYTGPGASNEAGKSYRKVN